MKDNKYYSFYKEAFGATLGGLLGEYEKQAPDGKGGKIEVRLKDTSKLVAGKSYTIYVDVEPKGNAADVDPVKVKLTLKVPK